MSRPRAILFDWDNTLVDSWDTIHDALHHCFTQMGREPWTLAEVKARTRLSPGRGVSAPVRRTLARGAATLFRPLPRDASRAHQAAAGGRRRCSTGWRPWACPLAVVSNKTGDYVAQGGRAFRLDAALRQAGRGRRRRRRQARRRRRSSWRSRRSAMPPGRRRSGISATPPWTCNAPPMPAATRCCCTRNWPGDADFARFAPALRFADCDALLTYIKAL